MADEHQETLKKKIQILFQLGKWPDVVKLCHSYNENYGKDMDVDMIRFKCERHMGIQAPPPQAAEDGKAAAGKSEPPMTPPPEKMRSTDPTIPLIPPTRSDELAPSWEEKVAYDISPEPDSLDVGDPFSENELVITDPFADDEPGLRLSSAEAPVVIPESAPRLEMESPAEPGSEPPAEESDMSFDNIGTLTIDAEPELVPPAAPPEPAAPVAREEEAAPDDPSRSTFGRVDVVAERMEEIQAPAPPPAREEPPLPRRAPFMPAAEAEAQPRKKAFNFKMALLAILPLVVAAALWLALSGKLDLSGDEPQPVPEPAAERPLPRRQRPAQPAAPATAVPQVDPADKAFGEKLRQAEELFKAGELSNALALLQEAKKIKVTEPLKALEEQIAKKIKAAAEPDKPETPAVVNQWQMESDDFAKAEKADTIADWQEFKKKHPNGDMALRAEKRIIVLEKQAQENVQRQLLLRIRQAQKISLRADPMNLSQADVAAQSRPAGRPAAQFEAHAHGGVTVTLDLTAGLMWSLYNKPMAYDKARWWANRITAGYSGWRLPTVEEALTLLQMDRGQYSGLAGFAVWTCDGVNDMPRTSWVLRLPAGQYATAPHSQMCYVWAVRKAGR